MHSHPAVTAEAAVAKVRANAAAPVAARRTRGRILGLLSALMSVKARRASCPASMVASINAPRCESGFLGASAFGVVLPRAPAIHLERRHRLRRRDHPRQGLR